VVIYTACRIQTAAVKLIDELITRNLVGWLLSWLEFNGTFSTKKLYCALQKIKFVKKLKDILFRGTD